MAARRWWWLVVLVVGIALFVALNQVLVTTQNPNLVPSLILLGAAVVPATFVAFVAGRRLVFGVGAGVIAITAFVGGVVGVVTAGLLEFDVMRSLGVMPMLAVGVIEEAAKLIGPIGVLLFVRHRQPADGLLVGVASGAGFAALETMGYAFVTLIQSKGNILATDAVLLLRGVLSPAAHMAWTGLTATALWYAAVHSWKGGPVWRFLVVFVLAVALHATWDSIGTIPVYIVLSAISLGLLTWFAHLLARETRVSAPVPA